MSVASFFVVTVLLAYYHIDEDSSANHEHQTLGRNFLWKHQELVIVIYDATCYIDNNARSANN
jgi:hypothetical protein